jgi:hypothetical protein
MSARPLNPAWVDGTAELTHEQLRVPFTELEDDEWIFFGEPSVTAGGLTSVYCSFRDLRERRLAIDDAAGHTVGTLRLTAERLEACSYSPEHGVSAVPVAVVQIPDEMPGGVYYLAGRFVFMVARPADRDNVTLVAPTSTMFAFNRWGGDSIYEREGRRVLYSTQAPIPIPIAGAEMRSDGFLEWSATTLAREASLSVVADTDLDRADVLENTRTLLLWGRTEYWTRQARRAFDRYIDGGGDALLICAETMLHEIRSFDRDRRCEYIRGEDWPGAEPVRSSVGPNYRNGGFLRNPSSYKEPWGSFTIINDSPLWGGTGIEVGDRLTLPIAPHDGVPLTGYGDDGTPLVDREQLPFARWELLGYSFGRDSPLGNIGALMALQKTERSGRILHFGSLGWTGQTGLGGRGPDSDKISRFAINALHAMHERREIFAS